MPCRKALQLLEHIALDMPAEVPTKRLLPAVLKAVASDDMEVREAALALLIRLARRAEVLSDLQQVRSHSLRNGLGTDENQQVVRLPSSVSCHLLPVLLSRWLFWDSMPALG